jgi:tRNA uridine 5-carboxymethylaminomethyl modification enzyme
MKTGIRLAELIKRPQLDYECLTPFDKTRPDLPWDVFEQVEIDLKYEGYIKRQQAKVDEMRRLEVKKIPADIDYDDVYSLRLEAREKLKKVRPESVGQASRISGVSPSDISVLLIHLSKNERK